jgi:mitochondrial fission protein ELM1
MSCTNAARRRTAATAHRLKTLSSDVGPVTIEDPGDRDSSFDAVIAPKHSRRLSGFDEQVLSVYRRGSPHKTS